MHQLTKDEQTELDRYTEEKRQEILARRVPKIDMPGDCERRYLVDVAGKVDSYEHGPALLPPSRLSYFRTEAEALDQDRHEQAYRLLRRSWRAVNPGGKGRYYSSAPFKINGEYVDVPFPFGCNIQCNQFLSMPGVTEALKTLYEHD